MTANQAVVHLESFRANMVDAKSAYVAISRARSHAVVYTDDREKLASARRRWSRRGKASGRRDRRWRTASGR